MKISMRRMVVAASLLLLSTQVADAQPLGTFRWQLSPCCNVVSVAVTQVGSVYRLEGTDDQCGATTVAAATGLAFQNPNGSIGFGFTIISSPGGAPVTVDAAISLATLNGTWRDGAGSTGSFVFTPGATAPSCSRRRIRRRTQPRSRHQSGGLRRG